MPRTESSAFPEKISIDIRQSALIIGRAVNFVGADPEDHAFRTAFIASSCAKELGWTIEKQDFTFLAGVLHNCGVPTNADDLKSATGMPMEPSTGRCIRGYEYAKHSAVLRPFANTIRYHQTDWTSLKGLRVPQVGRDTAGLIHLAEFAERLMPNGADRTIEGAAKDVMSAVAAEPEGSFNPVNVKALEKVMQDTSFWRAMVGKELQNLCANMGHKNEFIRPYTRPEARKLATVIAWLVDGKSPFTVEHSERVGLICEELGREIGFDNRGCDELCIAGLVHDVGYIDAPGAAVLKNGALNTEEFSIIKQHVTKTRQVLERCFPGARIAEWAANHHERLDGGGYPHHLSGTDIDNGSRIVAIADIFQALGQKRPYRDRKNAEDIIRIMRAMVNDRQLDGEIFDRLAARRDFYYDLATV